MRAGRLILPFVFLALGLWGCGRPRQSESPPAAGGAEEIITDETPAEESPAEEEAIAAHNERVIEKASKSLPDNAKELIALIEKDNDFRQADNRDKDPELVTRELLQAIPRVIAAGKKLREVATAEEQMGEDYHQAMGVWLLFRAVYTGSTELDDLVTDMKEILAAPLAPTEEAAQAAVLITDNFAISDPPRAIELCRELVPFLNKSDQPNIRSYATRLLGVERGLDLVGHTLEIKGTTLDGKPFDIAQLRGQVVLVDFFTTDGPYREDLETVRRVYDRRHKDGFEVVTISLDDNRETLDKFLEEDPIPWIVLYDGPWSENKNAIYYGVSDLPNLILIDREGKVVSHVWQSEAWRDNLDAWRDKLKELLGPGEPDEETDSDADKKPSDSEPSAAETGTKASENQPAPTEAQPAEGK